MPSKMLHNILTYLNDNYNKKGEKFSKSLKFEPKVLKQMAIFVIITKKNPKDGDKMKNSDLKRFINIPRLYTERLTLRRIMPSDLEDVYEYASDPEVPRFLLWTPHADRTVTKRYLSVIDKKYRRSEFYDWGIEYNGKMIGTCGFTSLSVYDNRGEIGYVLNREFWGMGLAREAVSRVLDFGFRELGLNRIEAKFMIGNDRSLSVMQKCNMTLEGTMKQYVYAKGSYRDVGIAAICADEYFTKDRK